MDFLYKKPIEISSNKVESDFKKGVTYFGLKKDVIYCKLCVISNQRPNSECEFNHIAKTKKKTIFFKDGICDACRYLKDKNQLIDWKKKGATITGFM